ncbi:VacB/RNase II family 3'-5' exoribonuclease [bacterium]|nr:VacB/RNase II family 3'-5' exoribonuclease [bacterium]NBX72222.1 VacB/RNase II family 3'-5' exoribonuclease [bacterium]
MTIHIPKNFIDPAFEQEKNNYSDPILSREALIKIVEFNKKSVKYIELINFYSDNEKKEALEFRIRAMIRDGQLILVDDQITTLDYWPLETGTVLKTDDQECVILLANQEKIPLYRPLKNIIFNGDFCHFAIITPLKQAAFYSLIQGSSIYLEGVVQDPQEYDLPEGYPLPIKITKGPFKHEIVSGRCLHRNNITRYQKVTCKLERHDKTDFILVDIVEDFPFGLKKVIRQFNLPANWSYDIDQEAKSFEKLKIKKTPDRKDLCDLPFVTIDSITAKDFDDAVCAQPLANDRWRLLVAVADVAHYVKLGTAIDKEASNRGVSVYFPDHVVPMLPEILSNELCSLKPDVLRYALVCDMELTAKGAIDKFEFYPAVIRSHARLTYDQVQQGQEPEHIKQSVASLWKVYKLLNESRKKSGYIFFAQQATQFVLDNTEHVLDIKRVLDQESHHLIEEMMLAANKCAAQFLNKHTHVGVYRTHQEPKEEKVQLFNILLKSLDLSLTPPYTLDKIAILSQQLKEKHPRLNVLVSRIMQRASYEPTPERHFGLNFDLYSHFTSPIRRYPDLIVHRLIYDVLSKNKDKQSQGYVPTALKRVNYLERRAEEAERMYHSYLKVSFIKRFAKKKFKGTVTGLAEFGLFIELEDLPIDGMIHVSQIDSNYWHLDEANGFLTSGSKKIRIGDYVTVTLASADAETLRINFKFVSHD